MKKAKLTIILFALLFSIVNLGAKSVYAEVAAPMRLELSCEDKLNTSMAFNNEMLGILMDSCAYAYYIEPNDADRDECITVTNDIYAAMMNASLNSYFRCSGYYPQAL